MFESSCVVRAQELYVKSIMKKPDMAVSKLCPGH
jgi:hypothetical protein